MVEPERAAWLWVRLERAFPRALCCVLMPDHLHLETAPGLRDPLRRVLTTYTTRFGVRLDLLDPEPGNSPAIVGRQMRYGYFNPVREGLVDDPWTWRWSTLRDLAGACHPVWTPLPRVAATLGLSPPQALRRLTTLGDHDIPALGESVPVVASVTGVCDAVGAALRDDGAIRSATGRRLVVQTCYAIGAPSPDQLAEALGCTVRTIHRARKAPAPGLEAVRRCLADERLRGVR